MFPSAVDLLVHLLHNVINQYLECVCLVAHQFILCIVCIDFYHCVCSVYNTIQIWVLLL